MPHVKKENLDAALQLYRDRLKFLKQELHDVVEEASFGIAAGACDEDDVMAALDVITDEVEGINECLEVLKYLRED